MTWWEIAIVFVIFWLYMTRMCLRWLVELRDTSMRVDGGDIVIAFCFWWMSIPMLLSDRRKRLDRHLFNERRVRLLIGESGWHKRERLAAEHKTRTQALGMPES